jgi:hypothetical protein
VSWLRILAAILLLLAASGSASSQGATRRLATVASLHQYPGYYHLQNVRLQGEFAENGSRTVLRGGERDIVVMLNDQRSAAGLVEVRGQLIDVGRLEPGDPRVAAYQGAKDPERWPRPGEELILSVTAVAEAQLATSPSVRALALQPWRFEGQKVTVVGQFHGRNLFGDLPSAPGKSRYDFVLRSADAAIWVTDLRPRGRGFDLSVDAKVDTGRWLQVSGTVAMDRGLVTIIGVTVATAAAPEAAPPVEDEAPAAAAPLEAAEMIFSSPTEGDINVALGGSVRVQFSRTRSARSLDRFGDLHRHRRSRCRNRRRRSSIHAIWVRGPSKSIRESTGPVSNRQSGITGRNQGIRRRACDAVDDHLLNWRIAALAPSSRPTPRPGAAPPHPARDRSARPGRPW